MDRDPIIDKTISGAELAKNELKAMAQDKQFSQDAEQALINIDEAVIRMRNWVRVQEEQAKSHGEKFDLDSYVQDYMKRHRNGLDGTSYILLKELSAEEREQLPDIPGRSLGIDKNRFTKSPFVAAFADRLQMTFVQGFFYDYYDGGRLTDASMTTLSRRDGTESTTIGIGAESVLHLLRSKQAQ